MALRTYLFCNVLENSRSPTTETPVEAQEEDLHLKNIVMLGDCVSIWLSLAVILRLLQIGQNTHL